MFLLRYVHYFMTEESNKKNTKLVNLITNLVFLTFQNSKLTKNRLEISTN